tara:strand:+ start:358 stop:540 length:183 start_codon:yes stop_codon:yes gene_type:complete
MFIPTLKLTNGNLLDGTATLVGLWVGNDSLANEALRKYSIFGPKWLKSALWSLCRWRLLE